MDMQSISQKLQDDIRKIMDVTNATNEAKKLVGGQVKLDKNHNGKLDSQDFKMLRGQKPVKEDSEQQDEATLSAKAGRAGKDLGKPGKNFSKIASFAGAKYGSEEAGKKVAGAILAKMRREETEQQDEASNWKDLGKEWSKSTPKPNGGSGKKQGTAYGGSKQKDEKPVKEDTEQIDELSKGTLNSYMDKAKGRLIKHMSSTSPSNPEAAKKSVNLATNMLKAKNKGGNYTEEFSFNDYLVAAIHIVGEEYAVELANYAFNLQDTTIFENLETEAFNASNVNATHAADVKAHHTAELKKKADAGDENAKKRMELIKKSREAKTAEFNSRMDSM